MRIHECDIRDLAALMGGVTIDEARYMAYRLVELRYFDTDSVPEDAWADLCRESARHCQDTFRGPTC